MRIQLTTTERKMSARTRVTFNIFSWKQILETELKSLRKDGNGCNVLNTQNYGCASQEPEPQTKKPTEIQEPLYSQVIS